MDKLRGTWRALAALACLSFCSKAIAVAATESPRAGTTPPRLSWIAGDVSSWKPGDENWTAALVNTALEPGDALYSGRYGRLEVQFGPRSYLRADAGTQLALQNQESDYISFKVGSGRVSVDVRRLKSGTSIAVDSPQGSLMIERPGYYRIEVSKSATRLVARRGGSAEFTPVGGEARQIEANEEIVVDVGSGNAIAAYAAPELDDWDRWSYGRTDGALGAKSPQYVGDDVYGAADLDQYGRWDSDPQYGQVWIPQVESTWQPYSTGSWQWDTYYGWTWIDSAPWGWAPFHYGRWVYSHNCWGWAPGPLVASPFYAPALVTFFGGSGFNVGIGVGFPAVSWVALGWGEPCLPWWGGAGFVGHPWWGGWGGPHVVNQQIVNNTNINITNINMFDHVRDHRGVVGVPRENFGNGPVDHVRVARLENERLAPMHDLLPRGPEPSSRVAHAPNSPAVTGGAVGRSPSPDRVGAPLPHESADQYRGSRVTSIDPRSTSVAPPGTTRGERMGGSPPPQALPSGSTRGTQHFMRPDPSSSQPLRFDQESLERRAPSTSTAAPSPDRYSVIQRAPQYASPRAESPRSFSQPPSLPNGGSSPQRLSSREPMPYPPAMQAAPMREAPAAAPRVEVPRVEAPPRVEQPRVEQPRLQVQAEPRAAMPQHAPAPVRVAPSAGGGGTASGGSHARGAARGR